LILSCSPIRTRYPDCIARPEAEDRSLPKYVRDEFEDPTLQQWSRHMPVETPRRGGRNAVDFERAQFGPKRPFASSFDACQSPARGAYCTHCRGGGQGMYRSILWLAALAAASPAVALPVYTDSLQSDFRNYSYATPPATLPDFTSTAVVRSGSLAIAFTPRGFNALSFAHETQTFGPPAHRGIRFWIHGGAGGGQALQVNVYSALGTVAATAPLAPYIDGGAVVAGQWRQVDVVFASPPLSYAGAFVRVDIQDGGDGSQQQAVHIDDVELPPAMEWVFADGFEVRDDAPPAACGLGIERDVVVADMKSDRFSWCDAALQPRVAVLAHNDVAAGPNGSHGGALREFRYRMPDDSERIATVTTYGNAGHGGFGYVVAHAKNPANCVGDDSPLGFRVPGTFERVFEGRHHAIFRFRQNYPRNCSVTGPAQTRPLPVVIDWLFATGRDHPLWAISYDLSAYPAGLFNDDSRAPYGELNIDGNGFAAAIDGVAWGDRFRFETTSAPVTLNSTWSWAQPNGVPFVKLWMVGQNATMGSVQTESIDRQDAGGGRNPGVYDVTDFWGKTSAQGAAGDGYLMPRQNEWPYQANAFSIGLNTASNNARLTWGTQYGFLGQSAYAVNDGVHATAPGHPKKSYSVFVVLGAHSTAPVETQRAQIEAIAAVTATAAVGSVVLQGAPGIDRDADAPRMFEPAGYDAVYSAWRFAAAGNALDMQLAVGAGVLRAPLIVVGNYTRTSLPSTLRVAGVALQRDVDYFPSIFAARSELWITLARDFAVGSHRIEILP
jgi:hypothetical protein